VAKSAIRAGVVVSSVQHAAYVPPFLDGTAHTPTCDDASLHVRITDGLEPTGSVTVYLPDGTALVLPGRDLVHLAPRSRRTTVK
jgi:hypothetical protein